MSPFLLFSPAWWCYFHLIHVLHIVLLLFLLFLETQSFLSFIRLFPLPKISPYPIAILLFFIPLIPIHPSYVCPNATITEILFTSCHICLFIHVIIDACPLQWRDCKLCRELYLLGFLPYAHLLAWCLICSKHYINIC